MAVTVEFRDEKQLEQIERLRGDLPVEDFIRVCVAMGLRMARQSQEGPVVKFPPAADAFKSHTQEAVTGALKSGDPSDPVVAEVKRLVDTYSAELRTLAQKNGNRLPPRLTAQVQAPIEKIALDITTAALNKAMKDAREAQKQGKAA